MMFRVTGNTYSARLTFHNSPLECMESQEPGTLENLYFQPLMALVKRYMGDRELVRPRNRPAFTFSR